MSIVFKKGHKKYAHSEKHSAQNGRKLRIDAGPDARIVPGTDPFGWRRSVDECYASGNLYRWYSM
ncbi:hypothetical protein KDK_44320 [Dictyobacter kobayashii]|uniref:Uncharacterized protein n=1 Tax=Dictyobacter kobayashii TaxID=2014872 RepID=A0A402ANG6_9CHLR|nr:hypothetical protein KDK_44320 [Dictyobacter kobayashii]